MQQHLCGLSDRQFSFFFGLEAPVWGQVCGRSGGGGGGPGEAAAQPDVGGHQNHSLTQWGPAGGSHEGQNKGELHRQACLTLKSCSMFLYMWTQGPFPQCFPVKGKTFVALWVLVVCTWSYLKTAPENKTQYCCINVAVMTHTLDWMFLDITSRNSVYLNQKLFHCWLVAHWEAWRSITKYGALPDQVLPLKICRNMEMSAQPE